MSEAPSPTSGAPAVDAGPLANAVNPATIAPRRMSEMGHAAFQGDLPALPPPPTKPANQQLEAAPEAESQPDLQPESTEPEQPVEGALTPEQKAAKYEEWLSSPDLPDELLTRTVWDQDGFPSTVEQLLKRDRSERLTYADYQKKTTEHAKAVRDFEQRQGAYQAFEGDLLSGDPERAMRALRWSGKEKAFEQAIVKPYVQRMAMLEELQQKNPALVQRMLQAEAAEDKAALLERRLQQMQQQQLQAQQQQNDAEGVNAPDIQHVMQHINTRVPALAKEMGIPHSDAFQHHLENVFIEATNGQRGASGQWIVAPTIQVGRTPSDDVLRQLVDAAWTKTRKLIAGSPRRQPQQLPPPPAAAAVTGPAAKPGTPGNISAPERRRLSDMR